MYDIKVTRIRPSAVFPKFHTPGAAGFDFHAATYMVIPPRSTKLIPTGLKFELPEELELQVRPRSGMSLKTKIRVANSPGTVDSDYRGEVGIILDNLSDEEFVICEGDRVAQGVICVVPKVRLIEVDESELSCTERGDKGFGSTGK